MLGLAKFMLLPAAMALGFAGEGVEEKGGITMHRLGREEGWRGRKEEGGEVPGHRRGRGRGRVIGSNSKFSKKCILLFSCHIL